VKIRIVTPDHANAEAWASALQGAETSFDILADVRSPTATSRLANGSPPDVVVAEIQSADELGAFEALAAAQPELDYVLVAQDLTPDLLMRAMRAGVREVLPAPASAGAVVEAVQRLTRKRAATVQVVHSSMPETEAQHKALVIGFVSCKGGSGATFVAANLAHVLANNGAKRVALIDLNLQFGDAALFVTNERSTSNVADVARNIHRLDAELLQSSMTMATPGLWVLPAPDDPAQVNDVTAEHVHAILALAGTMFDYVVVDVGRTINAVTLSALDGCRRIYVVVQLTLPFIRDGKRLGEVFSSLDYGSSKVRWIVNRHQKGGDISLEDLMRTLGIKKLITLPNQYDVVASSVNQGIPVNVLAPRSAIALALRKLAEGIAPSLKAASTGGGWLSGLLQRGADRTRSSRG